MLKFFSFINTNCIFPLLDCICSYLSRCLEKICNFFDYLFEILMRILRFFVIIIEKILSIFKPIFTCSFWIFLCVNLETCFRKIYEIFCQRICLCLSDFFEEIIEFNKKYLIYPFINFTKRIFFCFSDVFKWIFQSIIVPIKDYLLFPIYNFMMKYCFLVVFRVFQSVFYQIRDFFSVIFAGIYGVLKDIWFLLRELLMNIFFQGRKKAVINPRSQYMKKVKSFERDNEDLEQKTMNKHHSEQIFCLNKDDLFSIK